MAFTARRLLSVHRLIQELYASIELSQCEAAARAPLLSSGGAASAASVRRLTLDKSVDVRTALLRFVADPQAADLLVVGAGRRGFLQVRAPPSFSRRPPPARRRMKFPEPGKSLENRGPAGPRLRPADKPPKTPAVVIAHVGLLRLLREPDAGGCGRAERQAECVHIHREQRLVSGARGVAAGSPGAVASAGAGGGANAG